MRRLQYFTRQHLLLIGKCDWAKPAFCAEGQWQPPYIDFVVPNCYKAEQSLLSQMSTLLQCCSKAMLTSALGLQLDFWHGHRFIHAICHLIKRPASRFDFQPTHHLSLTHCSLGMGGQPALGVIFRPFLRHWAARDFLRSSSAKAAVHIIDADIVGYGHIAPDTRLGVLLQLLREFVDAGLKKQLVSWPLLLLPRASFCRCMWSSTSAVDLRHAGVGGGWAAPPIQARERRLSAWWEHCINLSCTVRMPEATGG